MSKLLFVGMVIACSGCTQKEGIQDVKKENWSGKYHHYTEVRGANDGTHSYDLEITKSGDTFDISYSESSMIHFEYKGSGKANKAGGLDVFFVSFESHTGFTKNFKPGNHMFSLKQIEQGTRTGVKLDWEIVPGDDLRRSPVTLLRVEPSGGE